MKTQLVACLCILTIAVIDVNAQSDNYGGVDMPRECAFRSCMLPDCRPDQVIVTPPGGCCPVCKDKPLGKVCFYKGNVYKDGQNFMDDCNSCWCRNGRVGCTKIGCSGGCRHKGQYYTDGQQVPNKDACQDCTCSRGQVQCHRMMCIMVACIGRSYTPPGACCPICRDDIY